MIILIDGEWGDAVRLPKFDKYIKNDIKKARNRVASSDGLIGDIRYVVSLGMSKGAEVVLLEHGEYPLFGDDALYKVAKSLRAQELNLIVTPYTVCVEGVVYGHEFKTKQSVKVGRVRYPGILTDEFLQLC